MPRVIVAVGAFWSIEITNWLTPAVCYSRGWGKLPSLGSLCLLQMLHWRRGTVKINVLGCRSLTKRRGLQNIFTHLNIHICLSLHSSKKILVIKDDLEWLGQIIFSSAGQHILLDVAFLSIKKKKSLCLSANSVPQKPDAMGLVVSAPNSYAEVLIPQCLRMWLYLDKGSLER